MLRLRREGRRRLRCASSCKDTLEKPPPEPEPEKEKSIEDIMASMKGIPGMEGIKMFSADASRAITAEQMGDMFGGGKPRSTTRASIASASSTSTRSTA